MNADPPRLRTAWGFFMQAVAAACVTGIVAGIVWKAGWHPIVAETIKGNRGAIYTAFSSVFGALLGFAIAAEAIVISLCNDPKLAIVRGSRHYATMWNCFIDATRWLGAATAFSLAGLILDREDTACCWLLTYGTFAAVCVASGFLARCVWVLEQVVGIVAADRPQSPSGQGSPPAPQTGAGPG